MAATGLRQRHGRKCKGGRCDCPWEASVYSKADLRKIRQTFPTRAQALAWRDEKRTSVRRGERAPTAVTINQAADAWLEGARSGLIRNSSGDTYKPGAIRTYERSLRLRVRPALGSKRLTEVTRVELQGFVDKLLADGLNASTISVTTLPVRAIYRRALSRGELAINPTTGLELPRVRGGRDRIAPPDECARLLQALEPADLHLWATFMYAGLRQGELRGLKIEDLDLAGGLIHVRRGWDPKEGEIQTKTRKERKVPIAGALRSYLAAQLLSVGWAEGFVFGATAADPFPVSTVIVRAKRAWKAAGLNPISPHECRHTFASLMIAAGVNAKALSTYMGHGNIGITLDRYGHLMPGNEQEAAGLLDAYLEREPRITGASNGASATETA